MAVSVPVPPPPPVAEVAPVALPIEVPRAGAATAARAASLDDEPTPPDAAPRAAVAEARPVVEIETQAASGPRLWVARGIDLLVPLAFGVGVALLESLLDGEVWEARGVWLPDYLGEWLYVHPHAVVHGAVAVAVGSLAYNLGCTRFWGRTAGRRLVCTDLVTTAGLPPGLIRITVRSIASLVSFAAFGAGHFWSVVDPERRSFHDRLAGTIVVDSRGVRSARPAL
ncbi:MAG: RDD family protein [Deltaproteobacteria bacterium]|nr:RDD family protein [Deltaproteobacteria bacterium]